MSASRLRKTYSSARLFEVRLCKARRYAAVGRTLVLGAKVACMDFGVTDNEILDAITYHTTGRPDMTRLDKIVYVADKTEQTRPYPLEHLLEGTLDEKFVACLKEAYQVCLEGIATAFARFQNKRWLLLSSKKLSGAYYIYREANYF